MPNRPPSAFAPGQRVRVVRNDRNRTPRTETIWNVLWHFNYERYDYFLEKGGRSYRAEDLEPVE